jgi:hypothetical protein
LNKSRVLLASQEGRSSCYAPLGNVKGVALKERRQKETKTLMENNSREITSRLAKEYFARRNILMNVIIKKLIVNIFLFKCFVKFA